MMRNYVSLEDWQQLGSLPELADLRRKATQVNDVAGYEPTQLLHAVPCAYPNPEQILIAVESNAEHNWYLDMVGDLRIVDDLDTYVRKATNRAYE